MAYKGDLLGFTFDNIHSSTLGITRMVTGNRFDEDLLPESNSTTAQVPGNDGMYYFGSNYSTKTITLNIGFDSLTDIQLRTIKQLFGDQKLHELVLDETPYKAYKVKLNNSISLQTIMIGTYEDTPITSVYTHKQGKQLSRIYQGEGTIEFVCFDVYAHSRHILVNNTDTILKYSDQFYDNGVSLVPEWLNADGELDISLYNWEEWKDSVGLIDSDVETELYPLDEFDYQGGAYGCTVYNPGSFATDFNLIITPTPSNGTFSCRIKYNNTKTLELTNVVLTNLDTSIRYNGKLHLLEGLDASGNKTGTLYNRYISDGDFFKIPTNEVGDVSNVIKVSSFPTASEFLTDISISYEYLFY